MLRLRSRPFFDPGREQVHDLGDTRRAQLWPPGGGIDPAEVGLTVELRQRIEGLRPRLLRPRLTPQAPERRVQDPAAPAAWITEIVGLLAQASEPAATPAETAPPGESLTRCEARVLRYMPTNLSAREIAGQLCLSANTVKTHQHHLYQKLGARNRMEAVERARALGLLPRSTRKP